MIQRRAEEHWEALPPQFRLESSLKQCAQSPFDRDFLAHVRLNHLHVLFLLRLLLLKTLTEPDIPIIETAGQMLALVVELILLRDQLTNSGTGLIWKVCTLPPILQFGPQKDRRKSLINRTRSHTTGFQQQELSFWHY
jgi:hypothetical protein